MKTTMIPLVTFLVSHDGEKLEVTFRRLSQWQAGSGVLLRLRMSPGKHEELRTREIDPAMETFDETFTFYLSKQQLILKSLTIEAVRTKRHQKGGDKLSTIAGMCCLQLADLDLSRGRELTCPLAEAPAEPRAKAMLSGLNQRLAEVMEENRREMDEDRDKDTSSESDVPSRLTNGHAAGAAELSFLESCRQLASQDLEILNLERENQRLIEAVSLLEDKIGSREDILCDLKKDKSILQLELRHHEDQRAASQANMAYVEAEIEKLRSELGVLEARLAEARGLLELEQKMNRLNASSLTNTPQNSRRISDGGSSEDEVEDNGAEAMFHKQRLDLHKSIKKKLASLEAIYAAKKSELEHFEMKQEIEPDPSADIHVLQELEETRQQWQLAQMRHLGLQQKIRQLKEQEQLETFLQTGQLIVLEEMRDYLEEGVDAWKRRLVDYKKNPTQTTTTFEFYGEVSAYRRILIEALKEADLQLTQKRSSASRRKSHRSSHRLLISDI